MKLLRAILICAAVAASACNTQTTTSETPTAEQRAASADAQFLSAATMYETYQIAAAQIAATQGRSQAVKTYAAAAATAHRAALQALIEIARTSRLPANDAMLSDNYRAYLDRLSSPSDVAFDARYSAQQAIVTMTMAGRYDAFTSTALHSELQQWATSQSQSIHDQISAARQLAAESAHP